MKSGDIHERRASPRLGSGTGAKCDSGAPCAYTSATWRHACWRRRLRSPCSGPRGAARLRVARHVAVRDLERAQHLADQARAGVRLVSVQHERFGGRRRRRHGESAACPRPKAARTGEQPEIDQTRQRAAVEQRVGARTLDAVAVAIPQVLDDVSAFVERHVGRVIDEVWEYEPAFDVGFVARKRRVRALDPQRLARARANQRGQAEDAERLAHAAAPRRGLILEELKMRQFAQFGGARCRPAVPQSNRR